METSFTFLDENRDVKKADLIVGFEDDHTKYIAYELEDEKNLDHDIMHFAEYDEVDGKVFLHRIDENNLEYIEKKLIEILSNEE